MTTFEYSTAFSEAVAQHFVALGFGPDGGVPHLGGVGGRLYQARTFTMPELEAQLGSLDGKAVLDFGSGTGATAVALTERGADVSAFDVDGPSAELCRMRLLEHGLDHVPVRVADSIALTDYPPGSFDIVLMNAVIEHVPKSVKGLRERVLNEAFAMLRPGGHLVICQSQNRLWPRDVYISGLWWLPWTKAGSKIAYRRMVSTGHHLGSADATTGARELEVRGLWGTTYFELRRYLPKTAACTNLEPGKDRHSSLTLMRSKRRDQKERALYWMLRKPFGIPVVAAVPIFWPLIFRKAEATD